MENENQNIINQPEQGPNPQPEQPTPQTEQVAVSPPAEQTVAQPAAAEKSKKRTKRVIFATVFVAVVAILSYFLYTNPELFKAEITEVGIPGAPSDVLYIPNYSAGAGEEGTIAVKAKNDVGTFDSITFTLTYSPVNALIFDSSPIVFDSETEFQSAAFQMTTESEPGSLVITIILDDPVTITDFTIHPILFKLETQINPDLPTGQVITIGAEDVALLNGPDLLDVDNIATGTIIVESLNQLKVLNAEATDSTHVLVNFSDYLSDIGEADDYVFDPALTVNNVESGNLHGYDQKSVVLTTVSQAPATQYVLTVDDDDPLTDPEVAGNVQGGLKSGFSTALFYGYGEAAAALSDFGMESAAVPSGSYNQVTVTFTDPVKESSVSVSDFELTNVNTDATVIINDVDVSGNQVTFAVDGYLLKKNTYLLTATGEVQRESDSAGLGINKVAFTGNKNGPRILNATVSAGQVQVNFDETVQKIGTSVGHLYETGAATGTLLDDASGYTPTVSGQTLTLTHTDFNAPNTNFTFSVSNTADIKNNLGVPVDETYKTITFWGNGHDSTVNNVGTVDITRRNVVQLNPGTGLGALDFIGVASDDVSLYWYEAADTKQSQSISSVSVVGDVLKITSSDAFSPRKHYILQIVDDEDNVIVVKEFAINQNLTVVGAEATSNSQVMVEFSANVDEATIGPEDFALDPDFNGSLNADVDSIDIQADFKHVLLELNTPPALTPATVYTVNAANNPDVNGLIYAYTGGNALGKSVTAFASYGTAAAQSDITLSSVNVGSSTQLTLNFSGAVNPATVTPVNIDIIKNPGPSQQLLTITNVTQISGSSYQLTTSKQTADANYFVVMDGVADTDGLVLGNAKVLNFFGFSLPEPTVTIINPSTITNNVEQNITFTGQNLNVVQTVQVGTQNVVISNQTSTSLTIVIPAGKPTGTYDITLIDNEAETKTFYDALLVITPETPMQVVSGQSKAIPYNVPNNGETETTLWVLVTDPIGLSDISSVLVNLSQIGGPSTQEMEEDTGTQPQYSQWYTYTVTVPPTVATSTTPYLLPVEVHKGSEIVTGTVSIMVTGDVYQSVPPVINQVYVSPISVPPDGDTPVMVSAQVSDIDGANTISSVVADLGSLGIGFVPLAPLDTSDASELTTRYYQSEEFTVPTTTQVGTYNINVTASDSTGESAVATLTLMVSTQLTGPSISPTQSYVAPRKSIPNDGATAFSLHVYITDPDGVGDITNVTAGFGALGLPPATLIKGSGTSDTAKSAYFAVENLTVPKTAPLGVHDIEITAEDSTGGLANLILQIDVTYKDLLGDPPMILEDKGYTTPKVAINDGETPVTLYVFVRDDDDDLESVVANLSNIGQVGPEVAPGFTQTNGGAAGGAGGGTCPTGSNVLVCMNPSVKEGIDGQWFILPGVTISTSTMPSTEPYMVDIMATDITGKTTHGSLPVYVNDGESFTNDKLPPEILVAVPTSATTIEVMFSEEIAASSVSSNGSEFAITDKDDINKKLNVVGATINATGTIVTLSTENQVMRKEYALSASSKIHDTVGVPLVPGAANRVFFTGFEAKGKVPIVEYVTALDSDLVEIEFRDPIKPSSLSMMPVTGAQAAIGGGDFNVTIFESDTSKELPVLGVQFGEFPNVLLVRTAPQKNNQPYRMQIKDIESYDGKKSDAGMSKTFKGYNMKAVQIQAAANLADLDGNGRVDFSDFTIFSSVYGMVYYDMMNAVDGQAGGTGGQPIPPEPDALVPITTEPTGGEVIPME